MSAESRTRFLALLDAAVAGNSLIKLTLGKYRGADPALRNLFIRPVALKAGPQLSFVWRHATQDTTKNHPPAEALASIGFLLGRDFLDAHLFTTTGSAQLECQADGSARLREMRSDRTAPAAPTATGGNDRAKSHVISPHAPWLHALGVTNERGQPREGMSGKFRQIQKFAELLGHLLAEANLPEDHPIQVVDMGCGKGYLTFAVAALLGERASVLGIEARPDLVELCNRVAGQQGFSPRLRFAAGTIDETPLPRVDLLIALHACDTATDDALAKGIAAGAGLIVVSPCCQKELRRQLTPPDMLSTALRHGIFQERQAEFVTDALRAQLLEWAGYTAKVFEFISTEHTAKNLMISAVKSATPRNEVVASRLRDFASFYGIRTQRLAEHLGFALDAPAAG